MQRRSSTQDISWFLDLRRSEQLDMSPPYQRRSIWNPKDQRFFLDTIFHGYPSPPIFLHKIMGSDQRAVYAVVDGKQRLETIFKFAEGKLALNPDMGDERLDGRKWSRLDQPERQRFWDYVIPVEFLTFDPNDTQEVKQAFDRLNRNMRKLDAQELRHARWDGWFIKLIERECDDPVWQTLGLVTKGRSKRMKDAQFLSELLMVIIDRKQHGFDQDLLDAAYANYDDPEEFDLPIDTDAVEEQLRDAKAYLASMQSTNRCVKQYAATLTVLYTLWSAVVLHRETLPEAPRFAELFAEFRGLVENLATSGGLPFDDLYRWPSVFYQNMRGANTELDQRESRLQALLKYVNDSEAMVADENPTVGEGAAQGSVPEVRGAEEEG